MCWYCGSAVKDEEPLGRARQCADCGRDLRVCRHCRFYLPGARGDCAEPGAEVPPDKERGNFCEWFSLDPRFRAKTAGEKARRNAAGTAQSAFEDLFK
ncbi:MAG: hypothetical protein LBP71_04620 [Spirochaetaceae bacterium]|jgi:hypothetical protein|nr:hypothetical protein [Spirochaetaceae bacterium]